MNLIGVFIWTSHTRKIGLNYHPDRTPAMTFLSSMGCLYALGTYFIDSCQETKYRFRLKLRL